VGRRRPLNEEAPHVAGGRFLVSSACEGLSVYTIQSAKSPQLDPKTTEIGAVGQSWNQPTTAEHLVYALAAGMLPNVSRVPHLSTNH
jgi:hypothetical protein